MRTLLRIFNRTVRRHIMRIISLAMMVLISVGFSAGIGMATDKMNYALDEIYHSYEVSDLIVKSTRESGFSEGELETLKSRYGEDNLLYGASLEFKDACLEREDHMETAYGPVTVDTSMTFEGVSDGVTRVYFLDSTSEEWNGSKLDIVSSVERPTDLPDNVIDVYAERETVQLLAHSTGERLKATVKSTLLGNVLEESEYEFFVRGIVENPLHFATQRDVSLQFEDEDGERLELENIFYIFDTGAQGIAFGSLGGTINDVYITLDGINEAVYSDKYDRLVHSEADKIKKELTGADGSSEVEVLTLLENYSFASFKEFAVKINGIGYVMMVIFLLVTVLVLLSTMTRLLEEERSQIACLMTLGHSPLSIVGKYLMIALIGTLIGSAGAYFAGLGLTYIIYINFAWVYDIPPFPKQVSLSFFFIVCAVIIVTVLVATLIAGLKKMHEYPATLLRPRAPRSGKKIFLERFPLLWNRLSFKYKSTFRNILRYKIRFAMTVVAVMASTALVFAGFAVLECCLVQNVGTSAMVAVALVVLVFAALLSAVVIYTLTNLNISERERELATLMVLGYYDSEVTGYMYREIYITSAIGILLGIPFGVLLCFAIFKVMGFGAVSSIGWYIWLVTPLASLLCVCIMTVLLIPKILKIRMNDSLKAIE